MNDLLRQAYDPEDFRRRGHQMVDMIAGFLKDVLEGRDEKTLDWQPPEEQLRFWEEDLRMRAGAPPEELFEEVLRRSVHVHNPNYMGHQMSPPAMVATLAGMLGDFLNNGMGVYEMGAPATAIERMLAKNIAGKLGFGAAADGVLTSGGSLANLTALLTARSVKGGRVWREGNRERLALMVSAEAHYCVDRAVRIMGWGEEGVIKVPVDDRFRMRTELLPEYLKEAQKKGLKVIAVVGSACTTSTGTFDDLEAISAFCDANDLWFHVDGAHGAALAFSAKYRPVIKGIEKADSVAMDFHKMLAAPSITTALLFRNGRHGYETFHQQGQYLWNRDEEEEWHNLAKRTFECTKLMLSVKVYSILRTYGWAFWDDYVTRVCDLGRSFAGLIRGRDRFELAVEPDCNIVCFRYHPENSGEEDINRLNERIRDAILEKGRFYIVMTRLRKAVWLRCTLTNPFTTEEHLGELLDEVAVTAGAIARKTGKPPFVEKS